MPRLLVVILMICFSLFSGLHAQDIYFRHLTIEDGLSQSTINCIYQDRNGFLWFGTENGLNRYDGYEFRIFKHDPADSNSLSHDWIWDVYEDSRRHLWIATWEGLNRYDPFQNRITRFYPDPEDTNSIRCPRPTSLAEDDAGNILVGTWSGGVNIYDPRRDIFTALRIDAGLPGDQVRNIYRARDGSIWVATWNGLAHIEKHDTNDYKITAYRHDPDNRHSLSSNTVANIVEDHDGTIWIATFRGGLNRLDSRSGRFEHFRYDRNDPRSLGSDDIIALFVDTENTLWIGTVNDGVSVYDRARGDFKRYIHDPDKPGSISANNAFSIFEDRSGLIWVGANGLNIFDKRRKRFQHFFTTPNSENGLSHNRITAFFEDKNNILWIGTDGGGINKYDPGSGSFTAFKNDPADVNTLSNDKISAVVGDKDGYLWIGTRGGGLNRFDPRSGLFRHYKENKNIPETEGLYFINDMHLDHHGMLWIATYDKGLIRYDPENDRFTKYRSVAEDMSTLSGDYLLTLYVDSRNNVWAGSWGGGMSCFDQASQRFVRYGHDPANPGSLSGNIVNAIFETVKGQKRTLWIGTNMGLSFMDPDSSGVYNFRHIYEKDGLPSNVISGILSDSAGNIWLSSNAGLCKYDPGQRTLQNYDVNDGLQSNEFIAGAQLQLRNGCFVFGGINGFNSFFPDSIRPSDYTAPVVLTSFKIFDREVNFNASINTLGTIELEYWQNFFSFEFASLDFTMPAKNRYAYLLEGFDRDWIQSGSRRYVSYTNLDAGNYVLRLRGTNSDGVWNDSGTAVKIIVTPPFWLTWWAYALYTIFIIGGILGIVKMRSWKLEQEKQQLEVLVSERTDEIRKKNQQLAAQTQKLREIDHIKSRFFANISHEFRTPLTLIKGPAEEMLNQSFRGKPEKAFRMIRQNANRLLRLINQLLDLSKLESGNMELRASLQPLSSFIAAVVSSFSSLAQSREIDLDFIKPPEEVEAYIDSDKLEKILYNLLSNAFKFTPAKGIVSVSLEKYPSDPDIYPHGAAKIRVDDSGSGIPRDEISAVFDRFSQGRGSNLLLLEGSGIGLALTKELVDMHHGEIRIDSAPGEGTRFDILLPLGKDHLQPDQISDERIPPESSAADIAIHLSDTTPAAVHLETEHEITDDTNRPVILVVEDNAEVRSYISGHLADNYAVVEAVDGAEGIEMAQEQLPDLVISDVMMPKTDGFDLTDRLKKEDLTSHIPIILLTAKASEEARIEGLETGADAYMAKPFNARELQVRVDKLIESRTRLREKFRKEFLLEPQEVATISLDDAFIRKVHDTIEERMSDAAFGVEQLQKEFALSQRQFLRKVVALTGHTPVQFIRIMRLKKARALIAQGAGSVSQIAFDVGFNNLSYFAKCFRQEFGKLPSEV